MRIIGSAIGIAVTIVVVAIAVVAFVLPRAFGGNSLTVLTGSMEPTLKPGDVVAVRGVAQDNVCTQIEIGQIITYLPQPDDPSLITHRVVAKTIGAFDDGTSCRLITQGDANSAADKPVSPVQVRGVFMYGVPKLGWVRQWSANHLPIVLGACGLLFLAYLVWGSLRPAKTRVVSLGGPSEGAAAEADHTTAEAGDTTAVGMSDAEWADFEQRLRELSVREHQVARREAELARYVGAAIDVSLWRAASGDADVAEPSPYANAGRV